jgi:hypothetical protein
VPKRGRLDIANLKRLENEKSQMLNLSASIDIPVGEQNENLLKDKEELKNKNFHIGDK